MGVADKQKDARKREKREGETLRGGKRKNKGKTEIEAAREKGSR